MNSPTSILFPSLMLSFAFASAASGQSIFVTTSDDVVDFGGAQQVADLPGPDGKVSLAEAGLASDNTPGVQTIGFHVPQSDWQYQWLYPGRVVLKPFLGFRLFDTAVLDGTTQTAFTGNTFSDGGEVVIWAQTYLVDNVGSLVKGLDNSPISVSGGSGNVIQGNTNTSIEVYDSPFAQIGGTNPGEGNTGGTIKIDRSSDDVVVGNTVQRVRVLGWIAGGQPAANVRIGGPTPPERNFITGSGTWSSEGFPGGVAVQLFDTVGVVVENNWIGTTKDGLAQGHLATTTGIGFENENHDAVVRNNRIAGILGHGIGPHYAGWLVGNSIQIYGIGSGISITGNKIGLDANDQPLLGSVTGIETVNYYLGAISGVTIGGTGAGEGNEIAGHVLAGIKISNTYSGVRITGNSIHDNGGLGIDLVTSGFLTGVTANDALDTDVGGNDLQNFPVLSSATILGASVRIVGTLNSTPSSSFTLDFYASAACDSSGYGEGRNYVGSTTLATNANGNAAFDVTLPAAVATGSFITATSTSANSSTSEFSACVASTGSSTAWTNLGHALAGTNGTPLLTGTGALTSGSTVHWTLTNARNSATAWLVIGFSQIGFPFAGGLLVPSPDIVLPTATTSLGGFVLDVFVPASLPSGQTISTQVWILDPLGIAGFAASNAIASTAP